MPTQTKYGDVCTITLAWQVFADAPVVLAANRDEALDRPAEPPARRDWAGGVVAPRDLRGGGTWIGHNDHGVVATIANRWDGRETTGGRSRGLLVRDALAAESASEAVRAVERTLAEDTYDGFYLLVVDRQSAILVAYDGTPQIHHLDPGVHVIVNVGVNGTYTIPENRVEPATRQTETAETLRERLHPEPSEDSHRWLSRARDLISDHSVGACLHGDNFGTHSSSLVRIDHDGIAFAYADGPPCTHPYQPVDDTQ